VSLAVQVTIDAADPAALAEFWAPDAKTGKNRLHLDVAAGASLVRECDEPDQFWIVMRDPEGNEFCLD
jgi:hypothetical protein